MPCSIAISISLLSSVGFYLAAERIAKGNTRIIANLGNMVVFGIAGTTAPINAYGASFGVVLVSVPLELLTGFLLVLLLKYSLIYLGICSYEDIWGENEQ